MVATASPDQQRRHDVEGRAANVQVLTAGTRMEQDQKKGKPMPVTVVTLLVTPEQAERLALASTEGKIQLALRNPLDTSAPATPGIKPATLLGSKARAAGRRRRPEADARSPVPRLPVDHRGDTRPAPEPRPSKSSVATSAREDILKR